MYGKPALSFEDMVVMVLVVDILVHTMANVAIIPVKANFQGKILQITKSAVSLHSLFPEAYMPCLPPGIQGFFGVWRSWLAHLLWEQRVPCSSHGTPTETDGFLGGH